MAGGSGQRAVQSQSDLGGVAVCDGTSQDESPVKEKRERAGRAVVL